MAIRHESLSEKLKLTRLHHSKADPDLYGCEIMETTISTSIFTLITFLFSERIPSVTVPNWLYPSQFSLMYENLIIKLNYQKNSAQYCIGSIKCPHQNRGQTGYHSHPLQFKVQNFCWRPTLVMPLILFLVQIHRNLKGQLIKPVIPPPVCIVILSIMLWIHSCSDTCNKYFATFQDKYHCFNT